MSEEIKKNRNSKYMGVSLSTRAYNKLKEAKRQFDENCYPEAISSCQECIELSIKAVFHFTGVKYPAEHEFFEDNFKRVLERIHDYNKEWFEQSFQSGEVERLYVTSMFGRLCTIMPNTVLKNSGGDLKMYSREIRLI